jgi:MFS family permease
VGGRSGSAVAIWLVSIGIGLLFLARGAFQPYIFPLFENLSRLTYAQVAILLNAYVMAQSLSAPLAGWYTDRTSVRVALGTSILLGLGSFLLVSTRPGFLAAGVAVFAAGLAFVLGKIALNTILVLESSAEVLRRSVATRATLLNLGSFIGNSVALRMMESVGYRAHALLLGLLYLPLGICFAARSGPGAPRPVEARGRGSFRRLLGNRGFLADALRRFAIVLPYGCWGTIIPKFVIDEYGSNENVWLVYLTSLVTTILGAHLLARRISPWVYRRGFRWEWWSMVSLVLYCGGLGLLGVGRCLPLLPVAVVVFILGEVVMTPCFDETAKKHSTAAGMASCMGLLHLVDGLGRMLGAAFALGVYGGMRQSPYRGSYWPVVVLAFFGVSSGLHVVAFRLARRAPAPESGGTVPGPGGALPRAVPLSNGTAAP